MSVLDIHPKDALDHVIAEFEAQARGEKILAADLPCLRKDHSIIYVDVSTSSTILDGVQCNVGFFSDNTKRKQAEEELKNHREHLEEIVKERTSELRSIVSAMSGREVRMAGLKESIKKLRGQVEEAGMTPVADDPLLEESK